MKDQLAELITLISSGCMTDEEIARFVQYYQRLTERALVTLPAQVDFCYQLESNRQICALLREIKEISQ